MTQEKELALQIFWETKILSMVKLFGWRLFNDRLPTENQLARRNIIQNDHN